MELLRLDKDVIQKGDRLFDLIDGVVEVADIREDSIMCVRKGISATSASTIIQYNAQGVKARARVRTLYWHNPVVALPRKDAGLWASQARIISDMVERFGDFISSAAVYNHETYDPAVSSAYAAVDRGLLTGTECRALLDYLTRNTILWQSDDNKDNTDAKDVATEETD